jgi:quercetin dioxygenase-like cupin family protein
MRLSPRPVPLLLLLLAACGSAAPTPEAAASEAPLEPVVRTLDDAPRRAAPPGTATVALLARGHNAFLGYLEMAPGASVPVHRDRDEEYLFIIEGRGRLTIDDREYAVEPGTTVFMPSGATVTYTNGEHTLRAVQVFAGPGSAAKYDRWTPVE